MDRMYFWMGMGVVLVTVIAIVLLTRSEKPEPTARWTATDPPPQPISEPQVEPSRETEEEPAEQEFPGEVAWSVPARSFVHNGTLHLYTNKIRTVDVEEGEFQMSEGFSPTMFAGKDIDRMNSEFALCNGKMYQVSGLDNLFNLRMRKLKISEKVSEFNQHEDHLYLRLPTTVEVYTVLGFHHVETLDLGHCSFGEHYMTVTGDGGTTVYDYKYKVVRRVNRTLDETWYDDLDVQSTTSHKPDTVTLDDVLYEVSEEAGRTFLIKA